MKSSELSLKSSLLPLLLLIGLAHFLVDTMLGIWPIYKSMAQLDMAMAGLIVAIGAFIGEGSQLLFGAFSDKGYRKLLIIIGLVTTIASAFLAYSSHYVILFVLYLITCIGSGSFHPCTASLVSGLIPARRSLLMAIFAACGSLGLATSQLTFTYVHTWFEGQTYILALPALVLAALLACYQLPQASHNGQKERSQHKASFKDFIEFFKNPLLRALYFSQVANQSILWGTIFILPDTLKVLGHTEWICYGGGHFCFIIGAACMVIPGGYLADLYSPRQIMLYGGIISCIAFYFILFSGGISTSIVLSALFVLGATLALMNPLAVSMGTRLEPNRSGAVSAFLMGLVWCLSEALGPGGVGMMNNLFDDYAPVKALAILGCLFLVQIYATICLPKGTPVIESPSIV
jgi:FSR family fosmidomycin resistance protein-like MFS transporter